MAFVEKDTDIAQRVVSKSEELKNAKTLHVPGLENVLKATDVTIVDRLFQFGGTRKVTCHFLYHADPERPDDYWLITAGVNFVFNREKPSIRKFTVLPVPYHREVLEKKGVAKSEQDTLFTYIHDQLVLLEQRYRIHISREDMPLTDPDYLN